MREIKFRVWDEELKKMSFVGAIDYDFQERIISVNTEDKKIYSYNSDIYIMQYIGMKDIDGKEIYERDLLKVECGTNTYEVKWDDRYARFVFVDIKTGMNSSIFDVAEFKVIGNMLVTDLGDN